MTIKNISFKLDSLEWVGGVSDDYTEIPLGIISHPLPIEDIAEVEWTIVEDNYIFISEVEPDTQLKYWFKLSEKVRCKIQEFSQDFFPFEKKDISDRYLIAYSVEGTTEKHIGFTFESVLKSSNKKIYVFMQAKLNETEEDSKTFLQSYLNELNKLDFDEIEPCEDDEIKEGLFSKIKKLFGFKK